MGFFSFSLSSFLSFFLSLGCIWYLFFGFELEVLFSVTNLLYWNLEHKINIFEKDDVQGEKNQKEKALRYATVFTGESVKITHFLKKTIWGLILS